jgi:hypothetical protein
VVSRKRRRGKEMIVGGTAALVGRTVPVRETAQE